MNELAQLVFDKSPMTRTPSGEEYCMHCNRETYLYPIHSRASFSCQWCGWHYAPLAHTKIFYKSYTPLKHWQMAYQLIKHNEKVSAKNIQRVTGVTYKTAWRLRKLILENRDEADFYLG